MERLPFTAAPTPTCALLDRAAQQRMARRRFTLPPADTCWLDRARSCDGPFDPAQGFVLCELDGEHYAISGRYCGIPDNEEAADLVMDLHEERGFVWSLDDLDQPVTILCRFPPVGERKRYTFLRW